MDRNVERYVVIEGGAKPPRKVYQVWLRFPKEIVDSDDDFPWACTYQDDEERDCTWEEGGSGRVTLHVGEHYFVLEKTLPPARAHVILYRNYRFEGPGH